MDKKLGCIQQCEREMKMYATQAHREKVWKATPKQAIFLLAEEDEVFYGGAVGGGKMLPLDTPLPTPNGWTTMGELKPGDTLFDEQGQQCRVLAVHLIDPAPEAYKLTFDDGTEIVACADHLWLTFDYRERSMLHRRTPEFRAKRRETRPSRVTGKKSSRFTAALIARNKACPPTVKPLPTGTLRTTKEIANTLLARGYITNHAIPVAAALELPEAQLPLDPYLLGCWLGDGTSRNGDITTADEEILDAFRAAGFQVKHRERYTWKIEGLSSILREIGVLGNKHIPLIYLRASKQQRLALLQGIMDTDGTVARASGSVEFTTTSEALRDGVYELIVSLGWKVRVHERRAKLKDKDCGSKWVMKWLPTEYVFRLSRKRTLQKLATRITAKFRYIVKCEPAKPMPMRCITVDSPSGLYLVGRSMVPTHNTDALLIHQFKRRQEIPGSMGLFLRRTYPELEMSAIRRAKELLLPTGQVKWQEQQKRFVWPNGSVLQFGYAERYDDLYRYQSAEFEDICIDEAGQFTEDEYLFLMSRLRTTKPGVRCYMRLASNPGGVGHAWLKSRFVDVARLKTYCDPETGLTRRFIPATLDDNPHIDAEAYERRLAAMSKELRRMYRYGDWDIFAGQYYPEFRREIHVVRPFEIPAWWRRFRSLDYGLDMTACYWWAVDGSGKCYIYRELYEPNLPLSEAAKRILEMTPEEEEIAYTVASPDLWNRRQETGYSGAEIMHAAGLTDLIPANPNRIAGWRALREYLKPYQDEQGVLTARLVIFENCVNLIRTLPALVHDERNPEDVSEKCEDHGPEAVRYGIMSRPDAGEGTVVLAGGWPKRPVKRGEEDDDLDGVREPNFYDM